MSLRWRLTILSTLVLALVFALFSALAYFTVRYVSYQTIDDNLERQSTADLIYFFSRRPSDLSVLSSKDRIGVVFYTVYDSEGRVVTADRNLPVDADLINEALEGQSPNSTDVLPT